MSLVWTLEKFTDSIRNREEEEDLRRQREDWPSVHIPGDVPRRAPEPPEEPVETKTCRLCGHTEASEYCVHCLAFTMEASPG